MLFSLCRELGAELAQRIDGSDRGVEVKLDDVEPTDADVQPSGVVKRRVGLHHAAHQRLDRGRHREVGRRVVAQQQRCERYFAVGLAEHVDHLQQVAQRAGSDRLGKVRRAQRAVVRAQAGNDRAAHAAALALDVVRHAQHDGRGATRTRIHAQAVTLAQVAAQQFAVDQRLGAGNRIALVVADHDGLRDKAQVHRLDSHLEPAFRPGRYTIARRATHQTALQRVGVVDRGRAGVVAHRRGLLDSAHRRRQSAQARGGARGEQVGQRRKILFGRRQVAVRGRQIVVTADAADAAGFPAHRSIATRGADHLQAHTGAGRFFADTARRIRRDAEYVNAFPLVGRRQRRTLGAILLPQPVRFVEHILARCASVLVAEPEISHLRLQVDPGLRLLKLQLRPAVALSLEHIDKAGFGQQLQCTAETGDDVEHPLHVVLHVEPNQRAQRVALADHVLDHGMRTLVRRSQHHQARTVARHQCIDHRAALVDASAHHQAAHAVREQADRLLRLLHQPGEELAKPLGEHIERLAPVIGERLNAVAFGEVLAYLAVEHCEEFFGLDRGLTPFDLVEAARSDVDRIEPDAVSAGGLQVRTHDAGQHNDDRAIGGGGVATRRRCCQRRCKISRGRQGAEQIERQRLFGDEPVAQGRAGVDVGEIVEVRDIGTPIEQHPRIGFGCDARKHRGGVDDQIVVFVVEQQEVGQHHAQTPEHVAALNVAGDDRHGGTGAHRRIAQQPRHRRVGQHCFDAGNEVRIGTVLRNLDHDALER